METKRLSADDNLTQIVADINSAQWDDANEMTAYSAAALLKYLQRADTLFITCYRDSVLLGIASARLEMKPYDEELWLYVDEVDVCADQRQQGAGKAIMRKLINLADELDCEEVWLGTETDNTAANALYRSLHPEEVEQFVGYTFDPDQL